MFWVIVIVGGVLGRVTFTLTGWGCVVGNCRCRGVCSG